MKTLFSSKLINHHLLLLSSHKICFKVGGNFKTIKCGTQTETIGHGKRIVGETFNFLKGLIAAKFRNFDAEERLTRSSKIVPEGRCFFAPGAILLHKNLPRGRAFDYLKKFSENLLGGMLALGIG